MEAGGELPGGGSRWDFEILPSRTLSARREVDGRTALALVLSDGVVGKAKSKARLRFGGDEVRASGGVRNLTVLEMLRWEY